MKTYEPIQAKGFESIEEYNTFLRETANLIYVNTLIFNDSIILLYTTPKEGK